jgi:hypothetical protein
LTVKKKLPLPHGERVGVRGKRFMVTAFIARLDKQSKYRVNTVTVTVKVPLIKSPLIRGARGVGG